MSFEEIPFCEEFHPTWEEMKDFQGYLTKCESQASSGIIKGYKARKDNYENLDFTIPHPIEQIINGNNGVYDLIYIQREAKLLSKYRKAAISNEKVVENKKFLDIEKLFWRTIKFTPPIYGADTPGSIFDDNVPWNLSELESILKKGLDKDIQGVTTPYLYIGAWKTLFAWHKEDLDLYSINYLHFGKPKCWYGIPPSEADKFDEFAKKTFPESFRTCPEFLRHKTFLINPTLLIKNGITVHKAVQNPGEFVVTFPKSYHAGFNMGYYLKVISSFNCAEAVNFALNRWIEVGKAAKPCKCIKDSVKIDLDFFCENLKQNRKIVPLVEEKKKTKKKQKKNKMVSTTNLAKKNKSPKQNKIIKLKEQCARMRGIGAGTDCKYVFRKKTSRKHKK